MAFVYTTSTEMNSSLSKTDFLHKNRSDSGITSDTGTNSFNHDPVYLKGNEGSCYWIDSKGLTIRLCDPGNATDISVEDIHLALTTVLVSVSSFDEEYVLRFAERLLSKIKDVFDMGPDSGNSIDVVLEWKSIALLILSSVHFPKDGIGVMIGSGDYRIFW